MFLVNYTDLRVNGTNYYYNANTYNNISDYFLYGDDSKIIYSYTSRYNNFSLVGGYSFDRNKKLSLGVYAAWVDYIELGDYAIPEDTNYASILGSIVWGIKTFKLFYSEGWRFSYNLRYQMFRNDEETLARYHNLGLNYTKAITEKFIIDSGVKYTRVIGGNFTDGAAKGGLSGYRGIPYSGIWTDNSTAVYADALYQLQSRKYLDIVGGVFVDGGYFDYRPDVADSTYYYSLGLSLSAYLKAIYLPGFGINIGTNHPINSFFVQIFIGLPF